MNLKTTLVAGLLLLAFPLQAQTKVFPGTEERKSTRLFYYSDAGGQFKPLGQASINYGSPAWKKDYEADGAMDRVKGTRWRFGSGAWTILDTNVDLELGGQKIAAGSYYLALEITKEGKFHLIVLDPKPIRKAKMDAFQAAQTEGGMAIELTHTDGHDKRGFQGRPRV